MVQFLSRRICSQLKIIFYHDRISFFPGNVRDRSFSPQNASDARPKIYPGVFPASPDTQIQEIAIQLGQNTIQTPDRIEKETRLSIRSPIAIIFTHLVWMKKSDDGDLLRPGPLETRGTPPSDRSRRELRHVPRRERPFFTIFGVKTHANVLKGTFFFNRLQIRRHKNWSY